MLRKCIKRVRKSARINKIKDKLTDIVVWTPVLLLVYANVLLLTHTYYKDDCNSSKRH